MPSHIFTRLGLWPESIASNLASAESGGQLVARRHPGAASFDKLHALDYLEYAYLQMGDETSARRSSRRPRQREPFDEPSFAAGYALARARALGPGTAGLERRGGAWSRRPRRCPGTASPYVPAITEFSRALGAARSGRPDAAREPACES